MTRTGLRSAASAGASGPTAAPAADAFSNTDNEETAADAIRSRSLLSREQTILSPRTRQNSRQLRSRGFVVEDGRPNEQSPSGKRRGTVEVHPPPLKRRLGLRSGGGVEASSAIEPTEQNGNDSEDGAEEQLQRENRGQEHGRGVYEFEASDDDADDGREKQPQGALESDKAGRQHNRTNRTGGKQAALGKNANAKAARESRQRRTGSEDLATPEDEQAAFTQTSEEPGMVNEDAAKGIRDNEEEGGGGWEEECDGKSGERETVAVTSDGLRGMLRLMGRQGWTNEGPGYAKELLHEEDEPEKEWLDRNSKYLRGHKRCKQLYAEVHHLLMLWRKVAEQPGLDDQIAWLCEEKEAFDEAASAVQASIDEVVEELKKAMTMSARKADKRSRSAKEIVKSLYMRIIPLLVLCLKQAFLVGTDGATMEGIPALGHFIARTIQSQLVITRRIAFLYDVLLEELEHNPPANDSETAAKQRKDLEKELQRFESRLKQAKQKLNHRADTERLRQQVLENYKLAEAARQERARIIREAQDHQMQLFVQSTWRMRAAQKRDEYYEKQGWYLREDEKVLRAMQESASPDFVVLQARLPLRSLQELVQRVARLRESSRRKHEARGMRPPSWCYAPSTRSEEPRDA